MKLSYALFALCQLFIVNAQSQSKDQKKIQGIIDQATRGPIPGVMIYVKKATEGEWTVASGFADAEKAIAMNKDFVFSTGSIGKMYNAVAAMKLAEQGKLQLDKKIGEYLSDEIITNIPNAKHITVRHLLANTAGIYNYELDPVLNELYLSGKLKLDTLTHLNALRRYVYGKPSTNFPGTEYQYSSTNFMLLAMIMDNVCSEGHTKFLRESIIDANGFKATCYRSTPTNLVTHYGDLNKDGVRENLTEQTIETTNWFIGDDGIYATITDAAHFLESLMKEGIVSKSSLEQMTTWNNARKPDYGLGLMADKSFPYKMLIGHSGRGIGMTTDLFYFPKQDMTVAIFCNIGIRNSSDKVRKAYFKMRSKIVKRLFLF
jgi:D-alanyl-D-alanine carboxypeptidase